MSEVLLIERLKSLSADFCGPVREALLDAAMALTEADALKAECADLIAGKEYQGMQRTLAEVNARLEMQEKREQETVNQLIDKTALLAAANERAGKLNRQLVELQDAIDSRDKAAGFEEVSYRPAQTVVWMIEQEFDTIPTEFWTGVGVTGWSRSALDGVRFAYKEDAERVLRYVLGGNRRYVREHIWIDTALASDSRGPSNE